MYTAVHGRMRVLNLVWLGTFATDMTTRIPRKTRRDPPLKVPNATIMISTPGSLSSLDWRRESPHPPWAMTACTEIGGGRGRRPDMPFLDVWSTSSALYASDEGSKYAEDAFASFEPSSDA